MNTNKYPALINLLQNPPLVPKKIFHQLYEQKLIDNEIQLLKNQLDTHTNTHTNTNTTNTSISNNNTNNSTTTLIDVKNNQKTTSHQENLELVVLPEVYYIHHLIFIHIYIVYS